MDAPQEPAVTARAWTVIAHGDNEICRGDPKDEYESVEAQGMRLAIARGTKFTRWFPNNQKWLGHFLTYRRAL